MTEKPTALLLDQPLLVSRLNSGDAVIIPTDTLPGLAVIPERAERIWALKRRPADKPLILMGATVESLFEHVACDCREEAIVAAALCWPGPVTLVLPARDKAMVRHLNPGGTTLGCRIPCCLQTQELLAESGPLATSSANRSGAPAARTAEEAAREFPNVPQLGPQPWLPSSGQASTVLAWQDSGMWQLLRRGAVMPEGLRIRE